jgi:diaminohydroxyphosphoribosylaminopyrimidine deaminase/5-amino-6-(5-phosphoribosylamino)uracil reductase
VVTPERTTPADLSFMRRALALAELGWGRVHPNPLVGAVVVREGEVVGEGFHAEYGGAHAEVAALAAAGERARGATLYVTLEPCAHHGKTPPCTGAVLEAGIARVVFAHEDPNPVARGGAELLRAAGIEVVGGVARELARAQNALFFHAVSRRAPFLALKYALTLDARLAESPHRPSAVTGAAARGETHRLRAGYDAIMVGIGTALADDPLLTVRGAVLPRVPPVRIVVDSALRLSPTSRLVETVQEAPVWVLCAEDVPAARRGDLERAGVRVLPLPRGESGLDLEAALQKLGEEGIRSIFCEGGGQLGASLLAADVVSRLYLFYAPRIFGENAVPAFPGAFGAAAEGWRRERLDVLDEDLLLVLDRRR